MWRGAEAPLFCSARAAINGKKKQKNAALAQSHSTRRLTVSVEHQGQHHEDKPAFHKWLRAGNSESALGCVGAHDTLLHVCTV